MVPHHPRARRPLARVEEEAEARSQLGRRIYSLAPHISLIKTAFRALSNQVLTVYPSDLTRVTMYIAVKVFVFMGPSVTRSAMSYASSSSAAGFASY